MKTMMKELVTMEEFENQFKKDVVTIFTFSADWCPDCLFIKPFLPHLIEKYKDYEFIYVDYNKFMDLAKQWSIMGIPSFVGVKNGVEAGRFVSKLRKSEKDIDTFLGGLE